MLTYKFVEICSVAHCDQDTFQSCPKRSIKTSFCKVYVETRFFRFHSRQRFYFLSGVLLFRERFASIHTATLFVCKSPRQTKFYAPSSKLKESFLYFSCDEIMDFSQKKRKKIYGCKNNSLTKKLCQHPAFVLTNKRGREDWVECFLTVKDNKDYTFGGTVHCCYA